MSRLPILRAAFKDISIYESKAKFFLIGYNDISEIYQILEINRPVMSAEENVSLRQDPQMYTKDTLATQMTLLKQHYAGIELIASGIPCLWGFVKLLESHYLIYVTKKRRVANILGHDVFTIEKTQLLAITYKARSTPEEIKYKAILTAMDLTKNFYFSYSYDLTRSYQRLATDPRASDHVVCQDMFTWNSYAVKPFAMIVNTTENVSAAVTGWIVPIIHGFLDQRSFRFSCGSVVHFTLIARRSRFFAGTRYLRRGVNGEGHVANEVESEQLFTLSDTSCAMQGSRRGRGSSLVQCRGSVPLFWSHVNLYSPKPDFRLEDGDIDCAASKAHFHSLFERYGRRVQCFNLVRQSPHKEALLGTAFRELCPTINRLMGTTGCYGACSRGGRPPCPLCSTYPSSGGEAVSYQEYDFLKNAHAKPGEQSHLFNDLENSSEVFFSKFGFYVDPPFGSDQYLSFPCLDTGVTVAGSFRGGFITSTKGNIYHRITAEEARLLVASDDTSGEIDEDYELVDSIGTENKEDSNVPEAKISSFGGGSPTGLLQYGALRVNCVDCLDRTNVAAFCYARVAIARQLKSLGFLPSMKALSDIVTSCMKVWAEHGDAIATQYGGSGAMHKVDSEGAPAPGEAEQSQDTVFVLTGGAKNALVAAQRYYSNVLSDYERQNSIDMLLGVFKPQYKDKHIWELKLRPENIRHGKYGRRSSDLSALVAAVGHIQSEASEKSPIAMLQQMSKNHFTDDSSEASSEEVDDNLGVEGKKEREILSHIEYHKKTKEAANVLKLATISASFINTEVLSTELTSFDNTLHNDYETLAVDNLIFTPFPVIESDWKPSIYLRTLADGVDTTVDVNRYKGKQQAYKYKEEKVYNDYLEYYSGTFLEEENMNFANLLQALKTSGRGSNEPLSGLSIPGCRLSDLISLTAREKARLASSDIDPTILRSYIAICPPYLHSESSANPRKDFVLTATSVKCDQDDTDDQVVKWHDKQKLIEIFDPFSLSTFPPLQDNDVANDEETSSVASATEESSTPRQTLTQPNDRQSLADTERTTAADRISMSGQLRNSIATMAKPKWQFWGSEKKKASAAENIVSTQASLASPNEQQLDAIPAAVEKPTPPEVIVPVEKGKETQRLQVVTSVASTTVASTTIGPSDADIALRISAAVNSILKDRMNEYEIENMKLKLALQCMQRKVDDLCTLGGEYAMETDVIAKKC